ncbi:hypothetical protein FH972_018278 [Carpinus fangiana]|uniref:Mitochondrial carrier protein n=1 Tax=Carpinus fangiana TaxID=176857 RepID=A0A5N6RLT9_9ROSI|nr:hypothetical protein FH972_018278 [Carpinus fangiana]
MHAKSSQNDSADALMCNMRSSQKESDKIASVIAGENKRHDFLRVFYGCPWWRKNYFGGYSDFIQTAGAIGGAASSLVRVPTEVVKQRMQTGQFASAPDAVRLIVAKEGFKGLYVVYNAHLSHLRFIFPFCIYEQLRIGYRLAARRELNDPENAIIGAFAGAITGAVTTPLDVIKTRLMVQGSANQYNGICDCVRTIVKEEGPHALLKGIGPRVLWIGIGGSIFFGVLERTKQILAQRNTPSSPNPVSSKDQL